jgi:RsiW-degrading membrane proteinase PrsW (M82 family)
VQTSYVGGDELNRVERVAHNRSGLWVAIIFTIIGLLLFIGIFNLILPGFGDTLSGIPLIVLGLIFSLVPAAIWMYFFYRLDRLEAEPKQLVLSVFLIGALVTAALHEPLIQGLYSVRDWQYNSWWGHLLGGILIVGVIEQAIIWATVRFTVFRNPEFDERVDGVIYSVAAGLGLATILNFEYVVRSGGVDLDIGSIRMVINALAYAAFAGIMGYFIGQARFEKTPIYYLPGGVALAAFINGLFWYLIDRSVGRGLQAGPWGDLIFAGIVAVAALVLVFWLIERANEETLRLAHQDIRQGIGMYPAPATTPTTETNAIVPAEDAPIVPSPEDSGDEKPRRRRTKSSDAPDAPDAEENA